MSTGVPPPLPWDVRAAPERLMLVFGACCACVLGVLALAHSSGFGVSACVWKCATGLPCAGCGGTRAFSSLLHGDLSGAFALNPAAVAAVIVSLLVLLYAGIVVLFRLDPWRPSILRGKAWRFGLVGVFVANWIYLLFAGRV